MAGCEDSIYAAAHGETPRTTLVSHLPTTIPVFFGGEGEGRQRGAEEGGGSFAKSQFVRRGLSSNHAVWKQAG